MKIICVGRNYADHAKDLGNSIPVEPVLLVKPKSSLLQNVSHFYFIKVNSENATVTKIIIIQ